MRRSSIILALCVTVGIFGVHNVYQSWLIVHVGEGRHLSPHGHRGGYRAIEVIAGGSMASDMNELQHISNFSARVPGLGDGADFDNRFGKGHNSRRTASQQGYHHRANKENMRDVEDLARPEERWRDLGQDVFSEPLFTPNGSVTWCRLNATDFVYKAVNGTERTVPYWQRRLQKCGQLGRSVNGTWRFFLAEILQVRVYESDKAKWTIRELKQWIHFMLLSGVEHIFLCDHYKYDSERLDVPLKRYIDLGLITYFPWSNIRNPMDAQIRCYQHIIDNYKSHTRWQIAIDMDEYPFALSDASEGFLTRFIRNMTLRYGARVTEISMSNYLMLGQGDRRRDMVIDRINRMTPNPANVLVKPIYRPERVRANIHHNHLIYGAHMNADTDLLRMLHYWGARGQDWGPDTPHTITITRQMDDMRDQWTERVRNSLLVFGEYDAFSNTTGP